MIGLGTSTPRLATGQAARLRRQTAARMPVATWGDSLTVGAGASAPSAAFPAVASGLRSPVRDIANLGIGGQTSTQIAARQGGVPIAVSLATGSIPGQFGAAWNFSQGLGGWASRLATNPPAEVYADTENGQLVLVGIGTSGSGAQVWLDHTFAAGSIVEFSFDIDIGGAPWCEIGLVKASNPTHFSGNWSASKGFSSGGHKSFTLVVGSGAEQTANSLLLMSHTRVATYRLSNLVVREVVSSAVSAKSVNILMNSGNYSGSVAGNLLGVGGTMRTDAGGNWTFERAAPGAAVAVPDGTRFVPASATDNATRTAWIWAGRGNYTEPAQVMVDIAAMVASLGHSRYLVAAILPSAADTAAGVSTIAALNANLAALYRTHFVDLLGALQAHAGGTPGDIADLAAGIVPRSLRSDAIHLNDAGYAIVAAAFTAAGI
ncbi:MAG: hypothetical protein CVT82_12610 [Alphaproteobacteria bacterium HGW-Alphaproteobacteria-4]|nr:MAG: hypothetical protein CVT82_12610 [Alphaproteobacteria bacterium HGW-Alphaproteobacteria-4]